MTDELLEQLQTRTDTLAVRVYHLLEEIQAARDGVKKDGSFPLDHLFSQIVQVEASAGWISQLADKIEDVAEGIEEIIV